MTRVSSRTRHSAVSTVFFLSLRLPPRTPLFPYTTLFRSKARVLLANGYSSGMEGEAFRTVSGQNSNNSVRVTDEDRKSTRLNSSHVATSYAVFCLKKKKAQKIIGTSNTPSIGDTLLSRHK